MVKGRGEMVIPLPPLPPMWVVVMMPPVLRMERKTERLYASLKASHYTEGQITEGLVALLNRGGEVTPSSLFNVFDGVALDSFTRLGEYWQQLVKAGAEEVHLAGSGPALYTLIKDRAEAEKIYLSLQQQRLESYLVETMAAIDKLE
jgi:4-diphosphocytidyl-2-C-methyl-D-erythritol kinase